MTDRNPYFLARHHASSGELGRYHVRGPDGALETTEPKGIFESGNGLERTVQDWASGSQTFAERFFVADLPGKMPDGLPMWLDKYRKRASRGPVDGFLDHCADEGYFRINKNDTIHNSDLGKVAWIEACEGRTDRTPYSVEEFGSLLAMLESMLKTRPTSWAPTFRELLPQASTLWQYPLYWQSPSGVNCKALFDCVVFFEFNGTRFCCPIDLKWAGNIGSWRTRFNSQGWVQCAHYTAGAREMWPNVIPMVFLIGIGKTPHNATVRRVSKSVETDMDNKYQTILSAWWEWDQAGRRQQGFYPAEFLRPYL